MLANEDIIDIVERYKDGLFLYCMSKVKNKHDADDIMSEVFLNLWIKKDELTNYNMKTWLYKCANNCIKRLFRKKQKYDNNNQYITETEEYQLPYITDNEYVLDQTEHKREVDLESIKNRLPAEQQNLFYYRYIRNMCLSEISKEIDVPLSTVGNRCQKLNENIRRIINEETK